MALSVTSGCAHFREGAERARGRDDGGSSESPAAPLPPPAPRPAPVEPVAPTPPPAPRPAPMPAPAPAPAPVAAPDNSKAEAASRKAAAAAERATEASNRKAQAAADKAQRAQDRAQDKAARRAEQAAPPAPAPVREPIADAAPRPSPAPAPLPAPAPTPAPVPVAPPASDEPASTSAIVTFASTAGTQCGACETVKVSVSPGGKVLIEYGHFSGSDWRYRRSSAHVSPDRAAAFAARVAAWRPHGRQAPTCAAPAGRDSGVIVEWFEMGRHDQLNLNFACTDAQTAEALRSAPALLGLKQLVFPWAQGR